MSTNEAIIGAALSAIDTLATLARQAAPEWIPSRVKDGPEEDDRPNPPPDERQVLTFINGDVEITDNAGRHGGGWGVRLGYYDHDRHRWRAGGEGYDGYVTHWMELPAAPAIAPWPPVLGATEEEAP